MTGLLALHARFRVQVRFGFLLVFWLLAIPASAIRAASPDDNARFLAGMPLPSGSSLAPLAETPAWKQHATVFDSTFDRVEDRQLSKIRDWSEANLSSHRPTLLYFFSGPDFLYANAFFPDATTYVLAGLEPSGAIPDIAKLPKGAVPGVLRSLEVSSRSLLNVSFFITARMKTELRASSVNGTLPLIYVFLARSGKVISDVSLVKIDADGKEIAAADGLKKTGVEGAKIDFASPGGPKQTLYYFSTNLANDGFKTSGLAKFCDQLGDADSFIKSASYLLHSGGFTLVRDFLTKRSKLILQDDTGIPAAQFGSQWDLRPFGRYVSPIGIFAGRYQPKLADVFRKGPRKPIDFGIGYRWRPNESNLLLAVKKDSPVAAAPREAPKKEPTAAGLK